MLALRGGGGEHRKDPFVMPGENLHIQCESGGMESIYQMSSRSFFRALRWCARRIQITPLARIRPVAPPRGSPLKKASLNHSPNRFRVDGGSLLICHPAPFFGLSQKGLGGRRGAEQCQSDQPFFAVLVDN